jgi:hypothetical protein
VPVHNRSESIEQPLIYASSPMVIIGISMHEIFVNR